MAVPSSLVNMEKLKDGNVKLDTSVNIYVRKSCLLINIGLLNLNK